jgi:hypothetical protein
MVSKSEILRGTKIKVISKLRTYRLIFGDDVFRCDNSNCNVIKNDCENIGNAYNVNDFAVIIQKHLNQ